LTTPINPGSPPRKRSTLRQFARELVHRQTSHLVEDFHLVAEAVAAIVETDEARLTAWLEEQTERTHDLLKGYLSKRATPRKD